MTNQRGFTLFEVLTVMVLIGVVTAFAAPSLIRIGNTANLRAARGAMLTAVNVAKSSAVTSGKCAFLKLADNAVSVFTTSCPGGSQTQIVSNRNFGTDYSVTVTLKKGSSSALTTDSIGFDPRGIPMNNAQTDTFTITKSGSTRYVVVGAYGRVN